MGGATRFLLVVASPLSLILHRRSSSLYRRFSLRPSFSSSSYFTISHHRNFTISLQHLPITNSSSQPLHTQSNSIGVDFYNYSSNQHHPWPEWCNFVSTLLPGPDTHGIISSDDSFVSYDNLSQEFVDSAITCLAFARSQPHLLGLLPRKDIEVVVQNGNPFLFQSGNDAQRRMRAFLGTAGTTVLESEIAQTVDLMKYLLSYASNPSVSLEKTDYSIELVESSVRNLLSELAKVINRNTVSDQHQVPNYYQQQPIPGGQHIEMKKGDWICSRCSFMNFARNVKCLECEEARPKRQLTGGEWECPQCDFFNYRRNTMCLRCDCKRPGEASIATAGSSSSLGYNNGDYENKRYSESKLAANEEKAERWFTKVSQSNNSADLSSAAADEDFPEIMPLRKGENRFVVSTRKTPLERRLANSQYQRNLGNEVLPEGNVPQNAVSNNNLDSSFGRRLDQIITRTQTFSEADDRNISGQNTGTVGPNTTRSGSLQDGPSKGINSGYVPFVPLPADMFAKKTESSSSEQVGAESAKSALLEGDNSQRGTIPRRDASGNPGEHYQLSENPEDAVENWNKEDEQTKKSDGWFNRVAELHNAPNSTNAISDEDFPDIMPMRKGENKFVVSKKKDRSLTSPMYKRQMAMDQANNNTFVPFVPFPPDYFAKKNKTQPDSMTPAVDATEQAAGMSPAKSDDAKQGYLNLDREASRQDQQADNVINSGAQSSGYQSQSFPGSHAVKTERWSADAYSGQHETSNVSYSNITRTMFSSHGTASTNASSRYAEKDNVFRSGEASTTGSSSDNLSSSQSSSNTAGSTTPSPKAQNYQSGWTGKSLEGSAVKETDPLDMSEEAKAERWFRRVAQIKDSSELSQIPDEDFPSIMPMRKGVNRFVVSKRKTPLERRLTSPQYRRNLPVVSSDPVKKDDDSN